jgi:hypothetical protein
VPSREDVALAFEVELQTRKFGKKLSEVEKSLRNVTKRKLQIKVDDEGVKALREELDDSNDSLGVMEKAFHKAWKPYHKLFNRKGIQDVSKAFVHARKETQKFSRGVSTEYAKIEAARQALAAATTAAARKAAAEHLKDVERDAAKQLKILKALRTKSDEALHKGLQETGLSKAFKLKFDLDESIKGAKIGEEVADSIKDGLSSLAGRDLLGFAKMGPKLAASLLKGGGRSVFNAGERLHTAGHRKADAPNASALQKGMGGMMKSVGGLMKGVGPLLNLAVKLGPMLSASASIFAAFVKVALDAEGAAKGMNKEILESASSVETLYRNGGDAGVAFNRLDRTLDKIRGDATDVGENLKWGMVAKDHLGILNVLTQEGVAIESLRTDFRNAGDSAELAASQVQGFGDVTRTAVAYSRLYGVSLNEIAQTQAEMFTDLGTSMSKVQLQFARMAKDATESGLAANKFFNIIRSASSDLALYNTRMEEASTVLKNLSTVMSPKNAAKFMSTMTRGLKDMSEEDRLKQTLLVGPEKMRAIVEKDLKRKQTKFAGDIAAELNMSTKDVADAAARGGEAFEKIVARLPKERQAAIREARAELGMDQNALKTGGLMGLSEAASNLSAAGAFTAKKAALQRFGGNKKLSQMTGVEAFATRKANNTSLEEFRSMAKLEAALDAQRTIMEKAFGGTDPASKAIVGKLNDLGITSKEQLRQADDADILAAMDRNDQEALVAATEQKDFAQETFKATTTVADKLEIVIEGIFEYLYVALKDVFAAVHEVINLIAQLPGIKKAPEPGALKNNILRAKTKDNKAFVEALADATVRGGDQRANMIGVIAPALEKGMKDAVSQQREAVTARGEYYGSGPLNDLLGPKFMDAFSKVFDKGFGGGKDKDRIASAVDFDETIDSQKRAAFKANLASGQGAFDAAKDAKFTPEDMQKFLAKSVWAMTPEELSTIAPSLFSGMTGPVAPSGSAPRLGPGAKPPAPPQAEGDAKQGEAIIAGQEEVVASLRQKGVKIDKPFLEGPYQRTVQEGALEAMRKALFEYALYSAADPNVILDRMERSFGAGAVGDMARSFRGDPVPGQMLQKNANGGLVTGLRDGIAVVSPAAGEGLASIGRGEKIVPSGGGSPSVSLTVNGTGLDGFARELKETVNQLIYNYERRKKFT